MSTTSAIGSGGGSAWADVSSARSSAMKAKMFAKADGDGSGSVDQTELQTLFEKVAKKTGTTAADAATQFSNFDTDGDGSLTSDELDTGMKSLMPEPGSTVDFAQQRAGGQRGAGGPPPGPPPEDSSKASESASSTSSTDPLDTNGDGTVSAQERAAGAMQELVQTLVNAMDSDQDGAVSKDELQGFKDQLSSVAASSATTSSDSSSASTAGNRRSGRSEDTQALQELVSRIYSMAATNQASATQAGSLSVTA